MEQEQLEKYLRCQIHYYDHCAKRDGNPADAVRGQMARIILSDVTQQGRMALSIERLKDFLPREATNAN